MALEMSTQEEQALERSSQEEAMLDRRGGCLRGDAAPTPPLSGHSVPHSGRRLPQERSQQGG